MTAVAVPLFCAPAPRLAPARGTEDEGFLAAFFLASSSSRLIVPPAKIFLTSSLRAFPVPEVPWQLYEGQRALA
jgi:hypothetical protein